MPKLVASDLTQIEFAALKKTTVPVEASTSTSVREYPKKHGRGEDDELKLTFSNISAHVFLPSGEKKIIMDGVSGHARTGQVMALMGPTGSGKVDAAVQDPIFFLNFIDHITCFVVDNLW